MTSHEDDVALWRRALAYCWYVWGLSVCYSATRSADRSLYRAGVRAFKRAQTTWPGFTGAFYRAGLIRGRELGEYAEALRDLRRAVELEPTWAEPYLQLGLFERFAGESAAALADLQQFIQLTDGGYWRDEAQRQIEQIQSERPGVPSHERNT